MSDIGWNSVTVGEDEKPQVSVEDLREMMADLDPEDFDESVQMFLEELAQTNDVSELKQAATLLLQDEVDFAPEMAEQGIEPDEGFIALLIAAGADVNAKNAYGQAPLHIAAKYGYTRIAEMLMMAGARKTLHDAQGRMPYELASQPDMLAMIQPSMADGEIPLPPEIEDADYVPEDEHVCTCGHHHESGHECHCHRTSRHFVVIACDLRRAYVLGYVRARKICKRVLRSGIIVYLGYERRIARLNSHYRTACVCDIPAMRIFITATCRRFTCERGIVYLDTACNRRIEGYGCRRTVNGYVFNQKVSLRLRRLI